MIWIGDKAEKAVGAKFLQKEDARLDPIQGRNGVPQCQHLFVLLFGSMVCADAICADTGRERKNDVVQYIQTAH